MEPELRQIQKTYFVESFILGMDGYTLLLRSLATKVKKKTQYSAHCLLVYFTSIFFFFFANHSVHEIKTSQLLKKKKKKKQLPEKHLFQDLP